MFGRTSAFNVATLVDVSGVEVLAGRDHLQQFQHKQTVESIAELVWNALDADCTTVAVEIDTASVSGGDTEHVTRITVTDDGEGIGRDGVTEAFQNLGDSWKRTLNGRTRSGNRILHGSKGRGRFYAYALGHRVTWFSVYSDGSDQHFSHRITGERSTINRFEISEPVPTDQPTGTTVEVLVEQGTPHRALLHDDYWIRLMALLASHLLGSPDAVVKYRGRTLDPRPLIKGDPMDLTVEVAAEVAGETLPVLRIVEWVDEVPLDPTLVLCTEGGAGLAQLGLGRKPIRFTAYVRWAGFEDTATDLTFAEMAFPEVLDATRKLLDRYVSERVEELKTHIVQRLRDEDAYPYDKPPVSPSDRAERDLYHHVVVTARSVFESGNRQQRQLNARLLRVVIEERPESLDVILNHALALPPEVREDLANLLRRSTLASVVRTASTVANRLHLLIGLRRLLYDSDEASSMREVDQLHPLVAGNVWLFGEEWLLSHSETSLTNVIRAVAPDEVILEEQLRANGGRITDEDGKAGRVDLLLHRQFTGPSGHSERLVVELKRPSATLSERHVSQVKRYARTLAGHQGVAPGTWTVWLVGTTMDEAVRDDATQADRTRGHVVHANDHDVWVVTWGDLIDNSMRRLDFLRQQLDYEVEQIDAVAQLRELYGDLIPDAPASGPADGDDDAIGDGTP